MLGQHQAANDASAARTEVQVMAGITMHRNILIRPTAKPSGKTVLIMPDWYGLTDAQEEFAVALAAQGHAALCVDDYGDGGVAAIGFLEGD